MQRDFDDFHDEFDQIRQQHRDSLDHNYYDEDYDPNAEDYYDLDVFSLEYAKSLFFGLGNLARYKGFNLAGHKCSSGITEGCSQKEYKRYCELEELLSKAFENRPLSLCDDEEREPLSEELAAIQAEYNELVPRCSFGLCEPCTATEHKEYIDQFINSGKDDPHDLYHLNNQTKLNPVGMPDWPVEPSLFTEKVVDQLESHGVLISDDMPELIGHMCRLFNFSIQPNRELPRTIKNLVFPAQTGIGKSVSVQVYVSLLQEHSSIIVVSKVEEAINYCQQINKLAEDEDYARCYYSLTDKNKDHPLREDATALRHHRCIVITHNMFRRVIVDPSKPTDNLVKKKQKTEKDKKKDRFIRDVSVVEYFGTYAKKPRDFVCIDEKLSFYEQFRLDYVELDRLITNVELAIERSKDLAAVSTSHKALQALKDFKEYLLFKDDKIVTNDASIAIRSQLSHKTNAILENIGEAITYSQRFRLGGEPLKLVGLKDKDAAIKALNENGIATQSRKRNVMGVSEMEVHKLGLFRPSDVESFYYEKFDPPIANCLPFIEPGSPMDNSALDRLFDDPDFNGELTDEQAKAFKELQLARNEQSGLELASSVIRILLSVRIDELLATLEALGAKKNNNYRQNTLNAINEQVDALRYFSRHHFLIYKTNKLKALIATENLVNQLGLSVVLDATATINEYYQLANRFLGHVAMVAAPQIRKYENLTIHKATGFSQARSAIYKDKNSNEVQAIAKSYASYALNELGDDDQMLIICHKDFVTPLKKQVGDKRVEYTHWGNHVGRNDWSHCNKVMLVGWNHIPPIEHVSAINASLDSVLLTSRHLDDELLDTFAISQLADDIVQGLMRSQARIIASKDSDCKPTSFYLFYKDDDKSRRALDLMESQFPGSTIIDWVPNGEPLPKKKTKRNKNADRVIELLVAKAKDHETVLRTDVQAELGIHKSTMGRVLESEYMETLLREHDFDFRKKDGKSQYFILR
jgi:hypothetical protein